MTVHQLIFNIGSSNKELHFLIIMNGLLMLANKSIQQDTLWVHEPCSIDPLYNTQTAVNILTYLHTYTWSVNFSNDLYTQTLKEFVSFSNMTSISDMVTKIIVTAIGSFFRLFSYSNSIIPNDAYYSVAISFLLHQFYYNFSSYLKNSFK